MSYDDLYQVSPWDQLAWDLGIDINEEQPCNPRLFKSHLPLSHLNPGAKVGCPSPDLLLGARDGLTFQLTHIVLLGSTL